MDYFHFLSEPNKWKVEHFQCQKLHSNATQATLQKFLLLIMKKKQDFAEYLLLHIILLAHTNSTLLYISCLFALLFSNGENKIIFFSPPIGGYVGDRCNLRSKQENAFSNRKLKLEKNKNANLDEQTKFTLQSGN